MRPYEEAAYGFGPIENLWWGRTVPPTNTPPLTQDHTCDVAIVGAGFTGLSAAYHLARNGVNVSVFDAQYPAFGASGRNGGFCCLGGGLISNSALEKLGGKEEVQRYRATELQAVDHVRQFMDDHNVDADVHSQGETLLAHTPRRANFEGYAREIEESYGVSPTLHSKSDLEHMGLGGRFFGGLTTPIGFGLNPQKYAWALLQAAQEAGACVFSNSAIVYIQAGPSVRLSTSAHQITAKSAIIATNGYSSDVVPQWMRARFLPVQSSVIVTRPLSEQEQQAQGWTSDQMAYDTRQLLHYFRKLPDGRFLFGMRGGLQFTAASERRIRAKIKDDFHRMFPSWRHVEIEHYWSGLVCFNRTLAPFVGALPKANNLYAAFGYHGNGVAMASYCGRAIAEMTLCHHSNSLPKVMQRIPRQYPLGRFRRNLLRPAYAAMTLTDLW